MIRTSSRVPKPGDSSPDEFFQSYSGNKAPPEDASRSDVSRLERRLEDWMRRVDRRLDTLLEAQRRGDGSEASAASIKRELKRKAAPSRASAVNAQHKEEAKDLCEAMTPVVSGPNIDAVKSGKKEGQTQPGRVTWDPSVLDRGSVRESVRESAGCMRRRMASQGRKQRKLGEVQRTKERASSMRSNTLNKALYDRCEAEARAEERAKGRFTLQKLVLHDYFDYVVSIVVVLNSVLTGLEVQLDSQGVEPGLFLRVCEYICSSVFALELILRLLGQGRQFCAPGQRFWALSDAILVGISIVDIAVQATQGGEAGGVVQVGSSGRLLKIIRMFRILRLLRMVRFLSELRVMAHMIANSMMSLFWLFSLLAILIYVFSIVLTQGATEYLRLSSDVIVEDKYGSLFTTMYTLFQAMCGGVSWGDATTPLQKVGAFYFVFALVYIFFCIFSVLNIVTGVFVDGAIELAKQDRSMIVAKQAQSREASANHLMELLREMDSNADDTLSKEEFFAAMLREDIVQYLDALSVDPSEAELLFFMLDQNGDGSVDIEEFVEGMQRLKGEAKSFDVHMLMHANRQVLDVCSGVFDWLSDNRSSLSSLGVSFDSLPLS